MARILLHLQGLTLGGGERVASYIASELHRRGHSIGLVTRAPGPALEWFAAVEPELHFLTAETVKKPIAIQRLGRVVVNYDILYSHVGLATQIVDGLACLLARRPHVVHQHTDLDFSRRPFTGDGQRWLYRRVVSRAEVISVSRHIRAQTIRAGVLESRAVAIPNGVELPLTDGPPPAAQDRLRVGMLCRLDVLKGVETFVAAARVAPELDFIIGAAPGPDRTYDQGLRDLALKAGVAIMSPEVPAEFLRSLDIVCLPSRKEGMPMALLEAMSLGKAVVASSLPGIAEVVDADSAVLVPVDDPAALAAAIRSLANSEARRLAMGKRAALRVRERYSVDKVSAAVADILEAQINGIAQ